MRVVRMKDCGCLISSHQGLQTHKIRYALGGKLPALISRRKMSLVSTRAAIPTALECSFWWQVPNTPSWMRGRVQISW
jgi:hypothetical protein